MAVDTDVMSAADNPVYFAVEAGPEARNMAAEQAFVAVESAAVTASAKVAFAVAAVVVLEAFVVLAFHIRRIVHIRPFLSSSSPL